MGKSSANKPRTTRGNGLLENYLSGIRANMAEQALLNAGRGRILDIGCGSYPLLLSRLEFGEKYGLDRTNVDYPEKDIKIRAHDLETDQTLPFSDSFFDAVCGLAVFEHLDDAKTRQIFREVYRVLAPGGYFIITVPLSRADRILKIFSRVGLISPEELKEHKQLYEKEVLVRQLVDAGFDKEKIELKTFELGLNLMAAVIK